MTFDTLPAWAEKFNFEAHSPSGVARPNCKEFFEKIVARPAGVYAPAGCRMIAGQCAELFAKDIVISQLDAGQAYRNALSLFDSHKFLEHDPLDRERFNIIRDELYQVVPTAHQKEQGLPAVAGSVLELTCRHTADGLREATAQANKVDDGRWVSVNLDGVELGFIGEIDVEANGIIEIKTKWPAINARVKRGWSINSLPSRPDINHVAQVALYWKWLRQQQDNVPVKIVYANCKGYRIFDSKDCDQLSESSLTAALDRMRRVARAREKMMQAAESVEDLFEMVAPDFQHFMWRDAPPAYRALADKAWGLR